MTPSRLFQLLRVVLRCDRLAPRLAREILQGLPAIESVRDDALLVTSELVSNAIIHAGCDPNEEIEVLVDLVPEAVRITVADVARSGNAPPVREAPCAGFGGIGLRVVEMLARRWGVERDHHLGVWAELAVRRDDP